MSGTTTPTPPPLVHIPELRVTPADQERQRTYWNTYGPHRGEILNFVLWDGGSTYWDDGLTNWPM